MINKVEIGFVQSLLLEWLSSDSETLKKIASKALEVFGYIKENPAIEKVMQDAFNERVILTVTDAAVSQKAFKILGTDAENVEIMFLPTDSKGKNIEDYEALQDLASLRQGPQESRRAFEKRKAALTKRTKEISKEMERMLGMYRKKLLAREPHLTESEVLSRFTDNLAWSVKFS